MKYTVKYFRQSLCGPYSHVGGGVEEGSLTMLSARWEDDGATSQMQIRLPL